MNTSLFSTVYAACLHVMAVAAVVVLTATGHIDANAGIGLLGGLLGFAVGVPVTMPAIVKDPSALLPPATLPAPVVTPASAPAAPAPTQMGAA